MGGSALLIYGTLEPGRLGPRPVPRSLLDRVLGRTRTATPKWSSIGKSRRLITLPPDGLVGLSSELERHVTARFPRPWASTESVLSYLRSGATTIYLRGDASNDDPPEFYVQVMFSGCAGMADVSAELAVHWAERWYREASVDLAPKYFEPAGFLANGRIEPHQSTLVFVPMGTAGYGLVNSESNDDEAETHLVELDAAVLDDLDEDERSSILSKIDETLAGVSVTSCACQWCAPQFDPSIFDRATPFH